MKPIYKSEKYYDISTVYYSKDNNISNQIDPTRVKTLDEVHDYIYNKITDLKVDQLAGITTEITDFHIDIQEEVVDYSIIVDWIDVRPGDYAIHIHSKNNVSDSIELGYDFYVGKLNRDKEIYVDKYFICWHAYQGVFLISRYNEGSDDKEANIPVLSIYDERLFPNLDELEIETGKKWLYSKVSKYASSFAIEDPNRDQTSGIEV